MRRRSQTYTHTKTNQLKKKSILKENQSMKMNISFGIYRDENYALYMNTFTILRNINQ